MQFILTQSDVMDIFRRRKAYLEGHFELSSGLHSPEYLQAALVLQYPEETRKLSASLASLFDGVQSCVVVSPAIGGIVLGLGTAEALGVRAIFAERQQGRMILRRGFELGAGERALLIEDIVTTGGSIREIVGIVHQAGASVAGMGCLIDRNGSGVLLDVKENSDPGSPEVQLVSLACVKGKSYSKQDCPLCRRGMPVIKPGSSQSVFRESSGYGEVFIRHCLDLQTCEFSWD